MKTVSYKFVFLFILLAFQTACGQTQTKTDELTVKVISNEVKESKTEAKAEDTKTVAEAIKTAYPNLKTQADEMGKVFLSKDFDKYANFMYPKLIEMTGGREKFVSLLNSSMKQFDSTGLEIVSYEVGEPSQAIEIDNQVFAVLPTKTVMKISQRTLADEGSIIAVSDDKGKNWKFVRAKTKEAIKTLFPKVVDKLTFSESVIK